MRIGGREWSGDGMRGPGVGWGWAGGAGGGVGMGAGGGRPHPDVSGRGGARLRAALPEAAAAPLRSAPHPLRTARRCRSPPSARRRRAAPRPPPPAQVRGWGAGGGAGCSPSPCQGWGDRGRVGADVSGSPFAGCSGARGRARGRAGSTPGIGSERPAGLSSPAAAGNFGVFREGREILVFAKPPQ